MEVASVSRLDSDLSNQAQDTLKGALNDILEQYLGLVHRYTSLHQSMAEDFASGFLSLARANFSNHSRLRYGQDFYDDRMQALTSFYINPSADESPHGSDLEQLLQDTISVTTIQPVSQNLEVEQSMVKGDPAEVETDNVSKHSIADPLNWFGILVPQALRASQSSFKHAVTETVPLLANLSNEMKCMEIDIRRMRKKIRKMG